MRPALDLLIPMRSAISRRLQCVASLGVSSSVAASRSSIIRSVIVAGLPGLGSSGRPSSLDSRNRPRHLPTVGRLTPTRSATSLFDSPSAHASMIRQRNAKACDDLRHLAQRSNWSRSLSLNVNPTLGRPVLAIRQPYQNQ